VIADDDHLLGPLLRGDSAGGSGAYNSYDQWSTSLRRGEAGSTGARLVTVHEALHASLNDTTAFGILLAVCAVLARTERAGYQGTLERLVGSCRIVHESFATYTSLWLVVGGDSAFLDGYPWYQRWYKDASDLVPVPDHLRRKEMMLEAAARACMQSPVLDRLVRLGPDSPDDVWSIPLTERPDQRFGLLHEAADLAFWARSWQRCGDAVGGGSLWAAIGASDRDPSRRPETYDEALATQIQTCASLLYEDVAGLLAAHGAPTLDYDGHRRFRGRVIEAVERAAPATRGMLRMSEDDLEETFEGWRRERLVIRERPRPAVLYRLEDLHKGGRAVVLLSGSGDKLHVFSSVRPAFRLLQQFSFHADDAAWLEQRGAAPVVTVRSGDGEPAPLDLTLIEQPSQLAALARQLPAAVPAHTNVSLACLGDTEWRDRWSGALTSTRLTGLVDLSPFAQFDLWRREGQPLTYAQATIGDDDGEHAELLVLLTSERRIPLLLVCTAVTGDILRQYLERSYPEAVVDAAVITDRMQDIEATASHLLMEEYAFDVAAYYGASGGDRNHADDNEDPA
jgi:hypothetical protein